MISDAISFKTIKLGNLSCFLIIVFLQQLYSNPFPWSDEWHLVPYAIDVQPLSWDWLWTQHVDHRIPIQKLIQVHILRFSGFDFRSLVLINSILAFLVTSLLISAIRTYRGYAQIGDLIVPLILMNPGLGPFNWGFHFQFMSSTLFTLCTLSFLLKNSLLSNNFSYFLSSICVLLLNFCGMNGVILSLFISVFILIYMFWTKPIKNQIILYILMTLFALSIVISLNIMVNWHPSGAVSSAFKLSAFKLKNIIYIANNFYYLINPRTSVLAFEGWGIYFLINSLLYLMAFILFARKFWLSYQASRNFYIDDFAIIMIIIATFGMLLSIVIGRSEYWKPGLEMHYGYLAVILPIVSWIAVSVSLPRKFGNTFGIVLVLLYGVSFVENTKWKIVSGKELQQKVIGIYGDIMSGMMINHFVNNYNNLFFYIDNEDTRRTVEEMIVMLKHNDIQPYTHLRD